MKNNKKALRLEWEPYQFERGWIDTFVHRISATDGLPPGAQVKIIEEIVNRLTRLRYSANLCVIVESPGKWFINEIERLCQPALPIIIAPKFKETEYWKFISRPISLWESLQPPGFPLLEMNNIHASKKRSRSKLRVIRILSRLGQAYSEELASLSDYSKVYVLALMKEMAEDKLVMRSIVGKYAGWEITHKGIHASHLSWNLPPGMRFTQNRREHNYTGRQHRRTSRMWPKWLRKAWGSKLELWDCWTEIYLKPGGYPDALAWGKFRGEEMLFWLEVDTGHTGYEKLIRKYRLRLQSAASYAQMVDLRIIFVLLAPPWVANRSRMAFTEIPDHLAVISHEWGDIGTLPYPNFGTWNSIFINYGINEPYQSKRRKGNKLPFDPAIYCKPDEKS